MRANSCLVFITLVRWPDGCEAPIKQKSKHIRRLLLAEIERSVVNTVLVQSATLTAATAATVLHCSIQHKPLQFEILQVTQHNIEQV